MKHKIKKSKTRKNYSKRVSKKATKRPKKGLKRKNKNSWKIKIKKGGDATTTIGLAAAAIGLGTAAMYIRRNLDPTDEDNLEKHNSSPPKKKQSKVTKSATQSLVDSGTSSHNNQFENYAELNQDIKHIYRGEIKTIFENIQKEKNITNGEYRFLEDLYGKFKQQPEFPLQGNIKEVVFGEEETKGGEEVEEPSFKDLIVRGIKDGKISYK